MFFMHCFAAASFAVLSLTAAAQPANAQLDPADSEARIPLISYQSAFTSYRPSSDAQEPPDKVWRATNEEMGKLGGHAGHMATEEKPTKPATPEPAKPAHRPMHR